MRQTPVQLHKYYAHKAQRCYQIYCAMTEKFSPKVDLHELVSEFKRYQILADLYALIVRRNRSNV